MIQIIFVIHFLIGSAVSNDIIVPVLYMPYTNIDGFRWLLGMPETKDLSLKFAAIHLMEKEPANYNIDRLYSSTIQDTFNYAIGAYLNNGNPPPASSIATLDNYWSTDISQSDIRNTSLEGLGIQRLTYGALQEMMLTNISQKMYIELSNVAVRLSIPLRSLSYSYDPGKWEDVVHAIVAEGIQVQRGLLGVSSVDRLAMLVSLTAIELGNVTIETFITLLPPIYLKKTLLDTNKTKEVLLFIGISAISSDAIIGKMVNQTTGLSVAQFGILYNLTEDQQRATERSTLQQLSQSCRISMPQLVNMTQPNIVWSTLGNMAKSPSCPALLRVKGVPIASLGITNPQNKTVLQILLAVCKQYWKSCRLTASLAPTEWECIDSVTLQQSMALLSKTEQQLLNSPVNDLESAIRTKCTAREITVSSYREKLSFELNRLFNLTASEVKSLTGISSVTYQGFSASQFVEVFLNASSLDLGISLSDMFNMSKKTVQELYESPIYELYEIIPFILRSAIKIPASQLRMSDANTFSLLTLNPDNSTIAEFKYGVKHTLPEIIISKNRFDNQTLDVYLTANSISDSTFGRNTTLEVSLASTGFNLKTLKTIYYLTDSQLSVLNLVHIKDLQKYCGLDVLTLKQTTPYNITAVLVGIENHNPTCKATRFYVAAKSKTVADTEAVCSTLASTSTSLMRIVELCTGLTWRYNARIFGVVMENWLQMDVLNRHNMPSLSDLSTDTVKHNTLQFLVNKANYIKQLNQASYQSDLGKYSGPMLSKLYSTFSTSKGELSETLNITKAALDRMSLLQNVEKVITFLKIKYNIDLSTVATSLDVSGNDLKYLAQTEWAEMVPGLKSEIVASGSSQLNVNQINFLSLLKLGDIAGDTLADLKTSWDSNFKRLSRGKTFSENKTIAAIQSLMSISQESLHKLTLLTLFKQHLNLTKNEISVLFSMKPETLDVLAEFTFKEIPSSCKFSEVQLQAKTPYTLLCAMTGYGDVVSCPNIAILVAFKMLNIGELEAKFNVTINETEPLLAVIEELVDLPFEKISSGLSIKVSDWTILGAVSLQEIANITSEQVLVLKNTSFVNVSAQVLSHKGSLTESIQKYHDSLLVHASELFALTSSETCGQCSIPSKDVLKVYLDNLGSRTYFNPRSLSPIEGFEYIVHDLMSLLPSKWSKLTPHIIPASFTNISTELAIAEHELADIFGSSKAEIGNMTLASYIQIVFTRIRPLVLCRTTMTTQVLSKAESKGATAKSMTKQNFLQILTTVCSNISIMNMSVVMGWGTQNTTILGQITIEDAALCKRMPIRSVLSRSFIQLVQMMLDEVHGCVVIPCRSGTILDDDTYQCADINECNSTTICQADQICQNYFGGYECECIPPGTSLSKALCEQTKRFTFTITFETLVFTKSLTELNSGPYYNLKNGIENDMDSLFRNVDNDLQKFYKSCRVEAFRSGSVIADVSVYTSPQFTGTIADLKMYFESGLNRTNGKTYMKNYQIDEKTLIVEDFNECATNQVNCHQEATCVNEVGTFSCKCNSGYDGDGVTCKAGFLKTYWWLVILFGLILLILLILIIVLVVKRPKPAFSYGVGDDIPTYELSRSGSAVSYKNGDVYYKDKDGNVRPGTEHSINGSSLNHQNPLYEEENTYETSWSNKIGALDNLGADTAREDEPAKTQDHAL